MTIWTISPIRQIGDKVVYGVYKQRGEKKVRLGYTVDSIERILDQITGAMTEGGIVKSPMGTMVIMRPTVS